MSKMGALPVQIINELIDAGQIRGVKREDIGPPASVDLNISKEIYRIEDVFLMNSEEMVMEFIQQASVREWDTKYPLERGVTYLARLNTELSLPESIYGYCNPKSSTGRNDVHVRVLANKTPRYDTIPVGYHGGLWIIIRPKSYPVIIPEGEFLTQARFFNQDTRFSETELQIAFEKYKLLWHKGEPLSYEKIRIRDNDGSLILTLGLSDGIDCWQCCGLSRVLDFSLRNYYNPTDFFVPIKSNGRYLHLKKGMFYILSTKEALRVPPDLACEVVPMDERTGDFRSHYAGFFDPGWGWGVNGEGKGRPATLEVRPFEDLVIRDGQPITKVRFERMIAAPETHYDQNKTSHYTDQIGPRLSKHFKVKENKSG